MPTRSKWRKAVRAEIAALNKDLPPGTQLGINIDRAVFIEASLHEVLVALGHLLHARAAVMYAFLGNWRATLIPAVTIPISILAACAAMYAMGFTLNVLTLLGMVLAIGLVVDDAIVVLENIYRRIEHGEPSLLAAIDGSQGNRLRGHRHDARAVRGVRADLVSRRTSRAAVQRVRLHAGGLDPVLVPDRADAHADDDVAALQERRHAQPRERSRRRAVPERCHAGTRACCAGAAPLLGRGHRRLVAFAARHRAC